MSDVAVRHTCPDCASGNVTRVPRRDALDYLMRFLGRHVYRCLDCGACFYDRPLRRKTL